LQIYVLNENVINVAIIVLFLGSENRTGTKWLVPPLGLALGV